MKDFREGYPFITAEYSEYAVANKIATEPALAWWTPDMLRRRDRIISKFKARYCNLTHKFGIQIHNTIYEAYIIDDHNGNTLWNDAINN